MPKLHADGHSACSVGFDSANMIGRGNTVVQDNVDLFSLLLASPSDGNYQIEENMKKII